jgi:stage II sporulation protein AB (anti-sigma F factor)
MKVTFLSRSANESFARVAVAAFIAQLDPTIDELADIKTAVSEAVTNCIVHAYSEGIGEIYITVKIFENSKISVTVKDKGCGIENIERAMEPMYTSIQGGERAGLGFTVMQSFTDRLRVKSRIGFGTTVIMEKKLGKKSVTRGT